MSKYPCEFIEDLIPLYIKGDLSYANAGGGNGNGAMPNESDDINFIIKWEDKEEHIVLKA